MEKSRFLSLYPWARNDGRSPYADTYFEVDLAVSRAEIWPFLCDTSRLNRAVGLGHRFEEERAGELHVREKLNGLWLSWIEHPWVWLDRSHNWVEREYYKGPFRFFRCVFHLEDKPGGGVTVCVHFAWICKLRPLAWLMPLAVGGVVKAFRRVLKEIETSIRGQRAADANPYRMRVPLADPAALTRLAGVEKELSAKALDPAVVRSLVDHVRCGDELELDRIRPLKLARQLGLDGRELLRACLEGTKAGLLNLSWDITCPHCRGVREETGCLAEIPKHGHCDVCDIDFATQAENAVEITFHVHESIRKIPEANYCAAEPAKKTHIKWQDRLRPGERRTVHLSLGQGTYRLRDLASKHRCLVKVTPDGPGLTWHLSEDHAEPRAGGSTYTVVNDTAEERLFLLEDLWWERDILHPGELFCLPEFQRLFSRDCLAAGVQLDLGNQTILFTDIVGSTKFYQEVGDARAFATVVEHFEALTAIIRKHDGAIIKTIGDAVMAAFHTPASCLLAAAEAQWEFSPGGKQKVRLRASIHHGPVIAVNWNTGKDYFGHVVNFAAKLQACAGAGEVAVSEEYVRLVGQPAYPCRVEELTVAGMKEPARVRVFDCSRAPGARAPGGGSGAGEAA